MAAERESCLSCCEIVRSADVTRWRWSQPELEALRKSDVRRIGEIILSRLSAGRCDVEDCYVNLFSDNVIRCVVRFAPKKGVKASQIANLVGIDTSCVRKATKGRYGYRQLLARLVAAKEDGSFENDAENVFTVKGRDFTDCYEEYHSSWLRGLKSKSVQSVSPGAVEIIDFNRDDLVALVNCINKNGILYYCDLSDLVLNRHPEWFSSVMANSDWLQKYIDSRKSKIGNSL